VRSKTKDKRTGTASYKAVVASLTKEMAQPRVAESARLTTYEQSKKRREKPTSHHARKTAKPHVEEYGTGTPVEESY
jgi:hypothetical protein